MSDTSFPFLLQFLEKLEELIPPPKNCHHAICLSPKGYTEDSGGKATLTVQINSNGKFATFFLDEGDFKSDPEELAGRIFEIVGTFEENTA